MIKAILFDWHGVLDNVTYNGFLETATQRLHDYDDEFPLESLRKIIVDEELGRLGDEYARGAISPEKFWEKVHEKPLWKGLEHYLLNADLNMSVWNLLPHLANGYKLALVSNVSEDKARVVTRTIAEQQIKLGISPRQTPVIINLASSTGNQVNSSGLLFDPVIYSYAQRRLKFEESQPSLYHLTAVRIGLKPRECLVVDDSARNITYAAGEGFNTLHYYGIGKNAQLMEFID